MQGSASVRWGLNQQPRMPPRTRYCHGSVCPPNEASLVVARWLPATPWGCLLPSWPRRWAWPSLLPPHSLPRFWASPWVDWLSHGLGRPTDHVRWLWELRVLTGLVRVTACIIGFLGAEWASPQSTWSKFEGKEVPLEQNQRGCQAEKPNQNTEMTMGLIPSSHLKVVVGAWASERLGAVEQECGKVNLGVEW